MILRESAEGSMMFYCPGCEFIHAVRVSGEGRPCWKFNGDSDRPTFEPSLLVTSARVDSIPARRCHSFIRDGQIQFLDDCTHALRGTTVPIPEWPYD
jgi:hypothetical protein